MKSSALILLLAAAFADCQFFYNYEEGQDDRMQSEIRDYDSSAHEYKPPSSVNPQYVQPVSNAEASSYNGSPRTRVRIRSRNYPPEPQLQPEYVPEPEPEIDYRAVRQERRQARRRQRQRERSYYVSPPSPVVYGPSIFENIGLGEAPSGVYVPQDSLLNVLRNPSQRSGSTPNPPQSAVTAPQTNNYVQPPVSYLSNKPEHKFFVQPPSNEEYSQPNLILPVERVRSVDISPYPQQARENRDSGTQNIQSALVTQTNRRARQRFHQPEYRPEPVVDIDSYRQNTDDFSRTDMDVVPQVQYAPVSVRRQEQRPRQNRRRKVNRYEETTPAPRIYAPSVFEKISLGEAPSGVHVPEDSLLNILRNPSSSHQISSREVQRRTQQMPVPQPTYNLERRESNYLPEVIEEQEDQLAPLPPPPPSPPRRRVPQRSRESHTSRRSDRRQYQPEYTHDTDVQPVQPSSQRRTQRINEDYDDYLRVRPQPHQEAPPPRRQQPAPPPRRQQPEPAPRRQQPEPAPRRQQLAPAPRSPPQTSSSNREQSSSRKAKLAIAELPFDSDDDGIPGEAGVDYPTFHVIPKTIFSCSEQSHNGYYADLETACQVVHLCQAGGVQNSFLCPNGTIFSQEKFSCQWWYKVNCNDAPRFYVKNDELYKVPVKEERKRN